MELKELERFRNTPIADKNFDRWAPIGTKVQIKNGKFAGRIGFILHQTTRHRFFMMIFLPELDIETLLARSEIRIIK